MFYTGMAAFCNSFPAKRAEETKKSENSIANRRLFLKIINLKRHFCNITMAREQKYFKYLKILPFFVRALSAKNLSFKLIVWS